MKLQVILSILIILLISYGIFNILELIKRLKFEKYRTENVRKPKQREKVINLNIGNKEKIQKKLMQAGYPLKNLGLNEMNYYLYKLLLGIIAALSVINDGTAKIAIYFFVGFFALDLYIRARKRRRKNEVKEVLNKLLGVTIDGLKMGQIPAQIMSMATMKIPEKNPLWLELKILNTKLYKGNTKIVLDEFRDRMDMEEVDNYCFALMQYELGGRAVSMLEVQLDLMNTLQRNKKERETQTKSNLSSIAVALLVGAMLIMILLPFIAKIRQIPLL